MTMPSPHYYRLHRLHLSARGNRPALQRALDDTLRYKGATATASQDADLTIDFAVTPDPAILPDDVTMLGRTQHGGITVWQGEAAMYLRRGEAVVHLDPAAGRATATLPPSLSALTEHRRRDPLFYLITLSLVILLRHRGWYPLHTAALTRHGHGLLIVAASDSGKSTAAFNLLRQGWHYLSDDTVLLHAEASGVRAYSFRRDFCIDPEATALFPELARHPWPPSPSDATKWRVDVERLYPDQFEPACAPRALVLPSIVPAATSTLTPAGPKDVLGWLINQSDFFMTPTPAVANRHLDAFRQLIDQCSCYRFDAGRDLLDEPAATDRLLAPLLDAAPAG